MCACIVVCLLMPTSLSKRWLQLKGRGTRSWCLRSMAYCGVAEIRSLMPTARDQARNRTGKVSLEAKEDGFLHCPPCLKEEGFYSFIYLLIYFHSWVLVSA